MKPNIFDIATKELSQDAFITWLLQFADDKFRQADPVLNDCGKAFVKQLIQKQIPEFDEPITKVEAGRQWESIDVWAEINDKYLLVIEDKTDSSHHSDQLARYKENAGKWCEDNNYKEPVCIYLKTGNESKNSLKNIEDEGFSIFSRLDFINLLKEFKGTENNIFTDFLQRLERIEKSNNEFEDKLIEDWKGNDWQGFFQFLEKGTKVINWHYVNNPNGGFWNAVLNWEEWDIYPFYIQLEERKLCFKVSTSPDEGVKMPEGSSPSEVRNQLHRLIMDKAKEYGFGNIRKPNRFGSGNFMTVAIVDSENWLGADDQKIDKQAVIRTLEEYTDFLKKVIAKTS